MKGGGSDDNGNKGRPNKTGGDRTGYKSDLTSVLLRKLKQHREDRENRKSGTNNISNEWQAEPRKTRKQNTNYHKSEEEDNDEEAAFEPTEEYKEDEAQNGKSHFGQFPLVTSLSCYETFVSY